MINKAKARRINALCVAHGLVPHDFKAFRGWDGMMFHYAIDYIDLAAKLDTTGGEQKVTRDFGIYSAPVKVPVNSVTHRLAAHEKHRNSRFFHLGAEA